MSPEPAWKQAERATARKLGGERTPLSGSNSRHTAADAIGTEEYVEHKHRKTDPVHEQLTELSKLARRRDRWPIIYYDLQTDHGPDLRWVAMWLDRYIQLKEATERDPEDRLSQAGPKAPWLVDHKVGARFPHAKLVRDTFWEAADEGRPPLIVVSRHRSPNRVALIPLEVVP